MSDKGFVYVLINLSMPGLVKVGKTQNDPEERAKELSRSTSVATPFQVAYKSYFESVSAAEAFVHTKLEKEGYRLTDNREFFQAELTDIINVVISAQEHFKNKHDDTSDLDQKRISEQVSEHEAETLFKKAHAYYEGEDEVIQDLGESLKLFKQASRLGSLEAFQLLGSIYANGEGVPKNFQKALSYYKKGGQKGNYLCYHELAMLFMMRYANYYEDHREKALKQFKQAQKSWDLFFKEALKDLDREFITGSFADHAAIYVAVQIEFGYQVKKYEALQKRKEAVIYILELIDQLDNRGIYGKSAEWIKNNL